jgi:Raf kinase inhibitor-like YbhB/YbcL family protein
MRRSRLAGVALLVAIGVAACSTAATREESTVPATMTLVSPAFEDGGAIPARYTCDGEDVSPPLAWDGVPDGTYSFALIVTDPDAGGFVHLVLTNIPGDRRELAEGEADSFGGIGRNGFGQLGWGGPCPPSGEHRYVFELLAVSEPLRVTPDFAPERVRSVAAGATLARAELTGVYARR